MSRQVSASVSTSERVGSQCVAAQRQSTFSLGMECVGILDAIGRAEIRMRNVDLTCAYLGSETRGRSIFDVRSGIFALDSMCMEVVGMRRYNKVVVV